MGGRSAMPRPVLLAVDGDPAAQTAILGELHKRYGADYQGLSAGSGAAGLRTLEQVRARDGEVALVLADLRLPDMTGIELLARAHGLEPEAKRAVLTGWGDLEVGRGRRPGPPAPGGGPFRGPGPA